MSKARFKGTCRCGKDFPAGASIRWDRVNGKLAAVECPSCNPADHGGGDHPPLPPVELRIKIQGVRFAKPDGSWTVAEALADGDLPEDCPLDEGRSFSAVGALGKVANGDLLEVYGNFQHDAKWGWQLVVQRAVPVVAGTNQALVAFLSRFPQVGLTRAQQILQALGSREAVIEALEKDPERLTVVAGITSERARKIAESYVELSDLRESALYLAGLDLGEALTAQILETYGADAKSVLAEDPYQMMELPGVGFKRADDLARRVGIKGEDPRRLAAAVLFLIKEVEGQGHTWSTINDLMGVS